MATSTGQPQEEPSGQAATSAPTAIDQAGTNGATTADATRGPVGVAVGRLAALTERELHEHPDVFEAIHADLQHALGRIDGD